MRKGEVCRIFSNSIIDITHSTMINKRNYESPEAELLEIKFERDFLETTYDVNDSSFGESATVTDHSNSGVWSWME